MRPMIDSRREFPCCVKRTAPGPPPLRRPAVPITMAHSRHVRDLQCPMYPSSKTAPFHLKVEGSSLPNTPLAELQALEFVVLELRIYLDTHSDDTEAFAMLKQYSAMERAARAAYESKYGPITREASAAGSSYQWLSEPWPWNFAQNEVK